LQQKFFFSELYSPSSFSPDFVFTLLFILHLFVLFFSSYLYVLLPPFVCFGIINQQF
jgi:hypothetical protein